MDTLTFLTELYGESEGYLTLWTPDKKTRWYKLPEYLHHAAGVYLEQDLYFGVGLGAAETKGRLVADAVTVIPGLWMDVDLATADRPSLPATAEQAAELYPTPPTITVSSGRGVHVYWLFREPWEIVGDREHAAQLLQGFQATIRQAATARDWKLDSTHDLARILRLPGSQNYKSTPPTPVTVISSDGPRYNIDDLEQFAASVGERAEARPTKFQRLPGDGPSQLILDNCIFMQTCRDYAAQLTEPMWLAALSNLARCSDGPEACHAISCGYPGYTYAETQRKIQHVLNDMGPQSCAYIRDTLGFNACTDCGVKAPVAWALKRSRRGNPVPDGFFDTPTGPDGVSKYTDLGNAEYFSRYYDGRVKHCSEMDKWLIWDGARWAIDGSSQIMVLAGKCVRSMHGYLSGIDEESTRKMLFKHANKSEDVNKLSAMVKLARGMMSVSVDALDSDPWLLNSPTGIIDLRTGELLPHDPAKNMTKQIAAVYDPGATCPTFLKFLSSTFEDNANIIGFMRRFLGYCLTGDTREQQFVIAWGSLGRNGKGTLLNLIADILADYAKATPSEVLYAKKFDKPSNDIARLAGARFVLASEGERGKRLDEPLVKKMTGQDILAARFLYRETFEFMPQFKLVMMTNDKPHASEDDAALWSRIQLVPFTRRFDGENQDKHLKNKLRKPGELSGILNWLLQGCLEWQRVGLAPPEEVLQATREYREENDRLRDWLGECCEVYRDATTRCNALYKSYQAWNLGHGVRYFLEYKAFNAALEKKGFEKYTRNGVARMRGIAADESEPNAYREREEPF